MAPGNGRRRQVASRHLVCASCSSWIQFDSSGCDTSWAETREGSFTFTCKGCKRVEFLVRELAELREMLVGMKRAVTGHGLEGKEGEAGDREVGLEDKAAETEGRVTTTGVNQDREESAKNIRKEEMIAGVEDEEEIRTEERKVICAGATLMATHTYTRNPESPLGKEIDLQQWDTLIFKGEHAENEHWRLVEDRNGQVGYAPAAFLVVILDTAEEEEESDATKKGLENGTEENRIGQEGERRKSYSAAVIDGIKRKSRIFVGDSIVRKTDTRLSKEEDVVVCLPGARIEHVTERVEKIMGRGKGGTILVHIGTNNADKEGTATIVDKNRKLLKKTKEARVDARSIINKKTEQNIMVDDIKPHIIGITESWANNDITNAELGLEGYVMFRKDRIGRRGGGVLLYIKDTIPAYEVQLKEEADCNDAIWCNLVTGHTTVIIGVVYRCPNITKQNNEKIHNAINEVSKGDCIIMGDFNHGNIKWDTLQSTGVEDSTFLCLVQDNFLTQHVLEPTRAARVLDIVLSSQKEFVDNVVIQEPLGSSDHNQLHFNIKIKSDKTKVKQCRRDFRKGNYKEIRKRLAHIDWNDKMKNRTATECWNILRGELDSAIDSFVPMKKQGKRSKKKHLSKEAFRKIRHTKYVEGL